MSEPVPKRVADATPTDAARSASGASMPTAPSTSEPPPGPYEKPIIRKYDQIDQVRPYGPSEI
jgi:hypothetical protein